MILITILLPLLAQAPPGPAPAAGLLDLQIKASATHRAYRDRSRGAQRCDPQTVAAASAANRLAIEASQRRELALTAIGTRAERSSAWTPPADPPDGEPAKAAGLLRRDMESSAAMLAKAVPGAGAPALALRDIVAQHEGLPRVEALMAEAGAKAPNAGSGLSEVAGELVIEEILINAYFKGSRVELERSCMEKPAGGDDPFRVPVRPAKPAASGRKGR